MIKLSRHFLHKDLDEIRLIHDSHCDYPFPEIENLFLYPVSRVISSRGEVIGAGFLKITSEAILILDLDKSKSERALAIAAVVKELEVEVKKLHLDQVHVFCSGPECDRTVEYLIRYEGFKKASGTPLVRNF